MGRDEATEEGQRQVIVTHHAQEGGLVPRLPWHHGWVLSRRGVYSDFEISGCHWRGWVRGGDPGCWGTRQQAGAGTGRRGQGWALAEAMGGEGSVGERNTQVTK